MYVTTVTFTFCFSPACMPAGRRLGALLAHDPYPVLSGRSLQGLAPPPPPALPPASPPPTGMPTRDQMIAIILAQLNAQRPAGSPTLVSSDIVVTFHGDGSVTVKMYEPPSAGGNYATTMAGAACSSTMLDAVTPANATTTAQCTGTPEIGREVVNVPPSVPRLPPPPNPPSPPPSPPPALPSLPPLIVPLNTDGTEQGLTVSPQISKAPWFIPVVGGSSGLFLMCCLCCPLVMAFTWHRRRQQRATDPMAPAAVGNSSPRGRGPLSRGKTCGSLDSGSASLAAARKSTWAGGRRPSLKAGDLTGLGPSNPSLAGHDWSKGPPPKSMRGSGAEENRRRMPSFMRSAKSRKSVRPVEIDPSGGGGMTTVQFPAHISPGGKTPLTRGGSSVGQLMGGVELGGEGPSPGRQLVGGVELGGPSMLAPAGSTPFQQPRVPGGGWSGPSGAVPRFNDHSSLPITSMREKGAAGSGPQPRARQMSAIRLLTGGGGAASGRVALRRDSRGSGSGGGAATAKGNFSRNATNSPRREAAGGSGKSPAKAGGVQWKQEGSTSGSGKFETSDFPGEGGPARPGMQRSKTTKLGGAKSAKEKASVGSGSQLCSARI